MIRQLLLSSAVAVMLCRTGLLFDVPFAVYIYNGSTLITRVLETGPSREELGAHHIHHLMSMVSGALLGASFSTVAAGMHNLEALLPTSGGTGRAEQSYMCPLNHGSAGIAFLVPGAQRFPGSLTISPAAFRAIS